MMDKVQIKRFVASLRGLSAELPARLMTTNPTVQKYSGRGMMGRQCVGISLNDESDICRLFFQLGEVHVEDVVDQSISLMDEIFQTKTDSLGYGIILYWPNIEWLDELDDMDDEGLQDWIKWEGGTCPVGPNQNVYVRFRNGRFAGPRAAGSWIWTHSQEEDDIMEYLP